MKKKKCWKLENKEYLGYPVYIVKWCLWHEAYIDGTTLHLISTLYDFDPSMLSHVFIEYSEVIPYRVNKSIRG